MMEKIKKYFRDFQIFKRIKDARGKADEEDTPENDEEMFSGDEEDDKPGDHRLNEGTHRKAPGFKRSVTVFVVVAGVLIFLFAYYNRHAEKRAREERPPHMGTAASQEPSNVALGGAQGNTGPDNYKQYMAQLREAENAKRPSNGERPSSQAHNPRQDANIASEPARRIPTVPTLPSSGSSLPQPMQAPAMSEADREAKAIEERYASAIAFSIGGISGQKNASEPGENIGNANPAVQQTQSGNSSASYQAPSNRVIQAGTMIPAMLFSGINPDAPGQVIAQIMADVYDTATHSTLLIPAGSRIVGKLDTSSKTKGSGRVGVVFSTLLLPDGGSYSLGESLVAADRGGYNGISGTVNRHTGRVLSGGALAAGLAALGSYASGNTSTKDTYTGGQLAMQGALANLINTTSDIFKDAASIEATVTIKPGYEFNVCVVQAISFEQR